MAGWENSPVFLGLYLGSLGFVATGIVGTLYQWATDRPADFQMENRSPMDLVVGFFMCLFAGPYMLFNAATRSRRQNRLSTPLFFAGLAICGVWSVCAGIFIFQALALLLP